MLSKAFLLNKKNIPENPEAEFRVTCTDEK